MRLRRGEHARLHGDRWAVTVAAAKRWVHGVAGRGRWSR